MSRATMIQPEQIEAARKLLQELPHKATPKTVEEVAASLSKNFRQALKKGYTFQDISELLKGAGISIPVSVIRRGAEAHPKSPRSKNSKKGIENAQAQTSDVTPGHNL